MKSSSVSNNIIDINNINSDSMHHIISNINNNVKDSSNISSSNNKGSNNINNSSSNTNSITINNISIINSSSNITSSSRQKKIVDDRGGDADKYCPTIGKSC